MKKILFALLAATMLIGCQEKKEENVVKIGANFTLTGDVAWWSLELKKGFDLALEEDLGQTVQVVYEDNEFKANKAVSIFNKFLQVDKVDAVVTCFSPMAEALIPLAERSRIPLIATCTSSTNITKGKLWSFRDFFTQKEQCSPLAEYIYSLGFRKGVYMVINDDYGIDGINQFKERFEALGGSIVAGETFAQLNRSSRNEVVKVLSNQPDFIFVIARDQALITLCNQIREMDASIQIVGINAFDSPIIWEGLGNAGNGIIFSSGYFNAEKNEVSQQFYNQFVEKYNEEPNYNAVYGYSILKYIARHASITSSNEDLRQNIEQMKESSVRGILTIDELHGVVGDIGIYKRDNGQTKLIDLQ